jgi:hypothetical protein
MEKGIQDDLKRIQSKGKTLGDIPRKVDSWNSSLATNYTHSIHTIIQTFQLCFSYDRDSFSSIGGLAMSRSVKGGSGRSMVGVRNRRWG